jgi:uncharacterized protein with HEPN domain
VPWRSAYGMRNAVTHGYFSIDLLSELISTLPQD